MATETVTTEPVTLINAFEVPAGEIDRTIAFWEKARDFLKEQPGFRSTRLHRALSPETRFQLINVARWQSPEAFRAAMRKMQQSDLAGEMRGTVFHAGLYRVIRTDGEDN
ncbi:antibiotic biosynthesis monooxygenase family protein [Roseibium sp. Sym1]|uniref:antibiotic biosynthesis monooxygenase family protein n=1 Tax=Roseibium sp. Sym1 TaxID=3016006 RepID=UPI0022B517CC|nr:antibiotic biosynthesis monooxygenase family protein [Roseibium sp. Sym1]